MKVKDQIRRHNVHEQDSCCNSCVCIKVIHITRSAHLLNNPVHVLISSVPHTACRLTIGNTPQHDTPLFGRHIRREGVSLIHSRASTLAFYYLALRQRYLEETSGNLNLTEQLRGTTTLHSGLTASWTPAKSAKIWVPGLIQKAHLDDWKIRIGPTILRALH